MKNIFSQQTLDELQVFFKTDLLKGLTSEESFQRLQMHGPNQIKPFDKPTLYQQLKKQLKDFLVILLLLAATINFVIGMWQDKKEELFEAFFILVIILGNAFLSIYYENKTNKTLALIEQKTLLEVKVIRDNKHFLIPITNLVSGDVVILEAGDIVSADMRLIQAFDLLVDESLLTGESQAILKNSLTLENNEKKDEEIFLNMVFMNTIILKGRAKGLVVATGMKTEIGKITTFIEKPYTQKTPLEKKITHFIKNLTLLITIIIIFNTSWVLFKNIMHLDSWVNWRSIFKNTFLDAIALTVAAVPEGLLIIMTLILALGMKKLTTKKAIVKNLKTLEILGSVNVICTDKTGTLTQNKMTVKKIIFSDHYIKPLDKTQKTDINKNQNLLTLKKLLLFGILCNDALVSFKKEDQTLEIIADPTEKALINLALLYQMDIFKNKQNYFRVKEIPFDSQRKMMTTFCINQKDNIIYQITKGAPEVILQRCTKIEHQGKIIDKNKKISNLLEAQINALTKKSLRVLAISYNIFPFENQNNLDYLSDLPENNLIFLGAVAMEDPIRQDAYQAIIKCQKAHITPIMITGDHLQTATMIAQKLNILTNSYELAITGQTLNQMSEKEFLEKLIHIKVYARTNPEDKLKIVKTWQKKGFIVAMTGDGVNDALSIKQADVGISMGISGTHVAKMASDMILTDDNFATIVSALEEGRNIFHNIKKSLVFLLSCNVGEIMLILISNFFGDLFFNSNFKILTAFQILWINLITDSLVAMALGLEPQEKNLMSQKYRCINENLLDRQTYKKIIFEGMMIALLAFIAALTGFYIHGEKNLQEKNQYAQTFAFMVLALTQLIHVWNLRSFKNSIFKLKSNSFLTKTFFISLFLQLMIIVISPIRELFKLISLSCLDFVVIFFFSILPLIIIEMKKMIFNKKV
ncbi:sodium/potassium-transporting P-type ATPase [Candidatus Phytoplasma solani]|uniref:cation-translocating P-type ATPase n=1 Tax=Candidatus Phytoplasma solani TaxID=69896 RepID=UPI0032D9D98A